MKKLIAFMAVSPLFHKSSLLLSQRFFEKLKIFGCSILLLTCSNFILAQNSNPYPLTGALGLGTASPDQSFQLHVLGNSLFQGNLELNGDRYLFNSISAGPGPGYIRFYDNLNTTGEEQIIIGASVKPIRIAAKMQVDGYLVNGAGRSVMKMLPSTVNGCGDPVYSHSPFLFNIPFDASLGREPVITTRHDLEIQFGNTTFNNENFILSTGLDDSGTRTELLRLQDDGLLGLGTASPTANLHVSGADNTNFKINNTQGSFEIGVANCQGCYANGAEPGDAVLRILSTERMIFATGGVPNIGREFVFEAGHQKLMRIQDDGQVNIGTGSVLPTAPHNDYLLAVDGKIVSRDLIVTSNWADYVFDPQYELMSLPDLRQYIAQHQHLPNIPAAEEVKANGLSVAQMQVKLMEKVEELTLYILELEAEMQELKNSDNQ